MPVYIRTDAPEGNAYFIMGIVCNLIKQLWGDIETPEALQERIDDYITKATSGNYENLKRESLIAINGMNVPPLLMFCTSDEVSLSHNIDADYESIKERNLWWKSENLPESDDNFQQMDY